MLDIEEELYIILISKIGYDVRDLV